MDYMKPLVVAAVLPTAVVVSGAVFAEPQERIPPTVATTDAGLTEFERCMMLECPKEEKKP